jgi:hypothetical protein
MKVLVIELSAQSECASDPADRGFPRQAGRESGAAPGRKWANPMRRSSDAKLMTPVRSYRTDSIAMAMLP